MWGKRRDSEETERVMKRDRQKTAMKDTEEMHKDGQTKRDKKRQKETKGDKRRQKETEGDKYRKEGRGRKTNKKATRDN